ncbi:MAG: GrpB family protein [Burkholderiales bacterium]
MTPGIEIVPYDPTWPLAFATEVRLLRDVLGAAAVRIEHVGSTSIPGLAAKPVIDIQISVRSLDHLAPHVEALECARYRFVSVGEFDHVYPHFAKPGRWPSTHHVHLCIAGGEQEGKHLAFRDYLRAHRATALRYVELKRSLAAQNHGATHESRELYSLAKTDFVNGVLAAAGFVCAGKP